MNELLKKVRDAIARRTASVAAFWKANRALALGGLTVISILLVVWARLGFTVEIGRFFATEQLPPILVGEGGGVPTPAPTPVPTPASLCEGNGGQCRSSCLAGEREAEAASVDLCGGQVGICCVPTGQAPPPPPPPPPPTGCLANGGQNGGGTPAGDASCDFDGAGCEFGYCRADGSCDIRRSRCDAEGGTTPPTTGTTTTTGSTPSAAALSVQCSGTTATLSWNIPANANSNAIQKYVNNTWQQIFVDPTLTITTYADTTGTAGVKWRHKSGANVASNEVSCPDAGSVPTSPSPSPTPSLSPTPTPSPTPTAVASPTPTAAPSAGGAVSLAVTGLNVSTGSAEGATVSALGSQEIGVVARIRNDSAETLASNIAVQAALPAGLAYVPGSTTVNGALSPVDSITTTGLTLAALGPQQESAVRFRVRVDGLAFPAGQSQTVIAVQVGAEGGIFRSGSLGVLINRPTAGTPGAVQTGPADAVLVALLVSAATTLLYISYTRSSAFRRHEVEKVSEEQGPLDFRS